MPYYLYIVRCSDNSLYTGITLDIEKRLKEHNTGKRGAKAVKGKLPVNLVYSEELVDKIAALKREREIKSWTKARKESLVSC